MGEPCDQTARLQDELTAVKAELFAEQGKVAGLEEEKRALNQVSSLVPTLFNRRPTPDTTPEKMGSATEDVGLLVRKWESASTWADERLELERELELERRRAADADAEREEAENARAEAEVARDELLERLAALERTGPGVETAASESKADGLAKQAEIERLEEELTNCRSMLNAQKRQRAAAESSVAAGSDGAVEELGLVMHSWEAAATDSERDNLVKQAEIERLEEELAGKQCDLDVWQWMSMLLPIDSYGVESLSDLFLGLAQAALARTTEQTRLYSEAKRQIEECAYGLLSRCWRGFDVLMFWSFGSS